MPTTGRPCAWCGNAFLPRTPRQRCCSPSCHFWGRVRRAGADDCWPWTGRVTRRGHGLVRIGGMAHTAHGYAYRLSGGRIRGGEVVQHRCATPACCNPAHLWAGLRLADPWNPPAGGRDTRRRGETHPQAKLSDAQVVEIRRLHDGERWTQKALANRFGVSRGTICNIVNYRARWRPADA